MNNKLFALGWRDAVKGFIVSAITVILIGSYTSLQNGTLPTLEEFKQLALMGLGAGISYLIKNFLENSEGKFLKKEEVK